MHVVAYTYNTYPLRSTILAARLCVTATIIIEHIVRSSSPPHFVVRFVASLVY